MLRRRMANRRPRAFAGRFLRAAALAVTVLVAWLAGSPAFAAPGQAERLGGVEPQGPATRSVTALHHNPAMLAQMPGLNAGLTFRAGVDQLSVARNPTDPNGDPTASPGSPSHLVQPAFDYFVGASFRLDPIAIGAGVYTLGSRFRPNSADDLRYHLRGDPDFGCAFRRDCPDELHRGGAQETRTDWTLALAWNAYDKAQIGLGLHFPRMRMSFARDEDTSLQSTDDPRGCGPTDDVEVEDRRCSERLVFDGRTRLRWFGLNPNGTRFDFALTLGAAVPIGDRATIGVRYRTPPLLDRGRVDLGGHALVCLSDAAFSAGLNDLPRCRTADEVSARVTQRLPQEVAIGSSVQLGARGQLTLDTNLFWTDFCPGGVRPGECGGRDAPILSIVGLDRDAQLLFEGPIHRGRADAYGAEIWGRYDFVRTSDVVKVRPEDGNSKSKPNLSLNFGGGFMSPAIRPSALTANDSDGWKLNGSIGTTIELRQRGGSVLLVPGYGIDLLLPTQVGPGGRSAAYRPTAAQAFAASGGDINGAGANAVLAGRGRPSNAGRYVGSTHVLTFTVRWAERDPSRR